MFNPILSSQLTTLESRDLTLSTPEKLFQVGTVALYESAGKNIPLLINLGVLFVKVPTQKNQVIDGFIRMFDFIQTTCCL